MLDIYFLADPLHKVDKNRTVNYDNPFQFSTELQDVDSIKKYRWMVYNVSGFVGQGNVITTGEDLLKFDNALYSGKIIKPST